MIAGLRGRLEGKTADAVLVDVGGVIFRVGTSTSTLNDVGDVGDQVHLLTHLFVREDQLTLYGFATREERRLFETLIAVTGVGPRLAVAILSHFPPDRLQAVISEENVTLLATVPGVGKKTAARLVLELRGKLAPVAPVATAPPSREESDVLEALKSLGYTTAEAHAALARAPHQPGMTTEERVVSALRELAEG